MKHLTPYTLYLKPYTLNLTPIHLNPLYLIPLFLFCISCTQPQTASYTVTQNIFRYATNISADTSSNTITIYISFGQQQDSIVYRLTKEGRTRRLQRNVFQIAVPLQNVATLSTGHIAMLHELGLTEHINGVCDYFRMSNTRLWEKYHADSLQDLGTSMNVNQELLLALRPDAIFKDAFSASDLKNDEIFHATHIPIIYTYSWHEKTPLARAEWILLFGMLFDKLTCADSVFRQIESDYTALVQKAESIETKPLVLAGDMVKSSWYMPGGQSYIARFIEDAGGRYVFSENTSTGSVPISFEHVLTIAHSADVWIGAQGTSYEEMLSTQKQYSLLPVFQKRQVYNYYALTNEFGGNDYWETGYVRPDIVLADILKIFHPDSLPEHDLVFYKALE